MLHSILEKIDKNQTVLIVAQKEVTGTGNTWQYLLLFAYIVKAAKEGRFTNGFDDEGEEKEFIRILNKVYESPDVAIEALGPLGDANTISAILEALDRLFEGEYVDGE